MFSTLCTLQEAYNIPSFDTAGKKKRPCAAPKASADPYDPFFPENGRGESASYREGFQGQSRSSNTANREQTINPPSYKGLAADYDYYRKEYGIETPKLTENFEQAPADFNKCTSKELRYDYPMSDADKKQFDAAMKTALDQPTAATKHVPSEMRKSDMSQVQGYFDEDLEQYLQTKDMKAAPTPTIKRTAQDSMTHTLPYDPDSSPFAEAMRQFQTPPSTASPPPQPAPPSRPTDIWSQLSDVFIFVFAGVILIFLCDQLFKLALMIGMKRTMDMMHPYLLKQS